MIGGKKWISIVAGLAALAATCFIAGRTTAPKSTHEIRTVEVAKKTEIVATVETAQAAIVQTNTVIKYVDRIVRMPSGETIETKTSVASATKRNENTAETKVAKVAIASEASRTTVDRVVTVRAPAPRFSVGAFVSSGLDFKPHYGTEIGVRVIGPTWLTVGADIRSRALTAGLLVIF